jgi:transcription antitermination factor NusG
MESEKQWHAVYTKPGWEKKVTESLSKRDIESYCPLNKIVTAWGNRKRTAYQPLFSSFVFLRISDAQYANIKQIKGVASFAYWLGKPALIREEEIETIHAFITDHNNVILEKISLPVANRIRNAKGFQLYSEEDMPEVNNNCVKAYLPSLLFAMVAELPVASVETIQHNMIPLALSIT